MEKVYTMRKPGNKKPTMRDNLAGDYRVVQNSPTFVARADKTPEGLGERDDFAWAIARELSAFFYDEGINAKGEGYYFRVAQSNLDKSSVRRKYKEDPKRFRDGNGKQLTLADFGRNMVRYFKKNAAWGYCHSVEEVVSTFFDPVTLDDCAKGLWRVYRTRRQMRGIN